MTKPNLSEAYANSTPDRHNRRRASLAATFKPNALYDRLLALRERDAAAYTARTTHTLRLTIAHYAESKSAFEEVTQ